MPVRCAHVWVVLLCFVCTPITAAAQSAVNSAFSDEKLWDFGVWGAEAVGKTAGEGFGATQITMAGVHVGRVFHRASPESGHRRTWEYTFELQPLFLITHGEQVYGGGFAPVGVRCNFAPRGRYRPYLEFNGGAMITQKNVPRGETSAFNFTAALGPGVVIALTPTQAVSVAVRMWHLSNAYIGADNPSFNTVQLQVGYHWLTTGHTRRRRLSAAPAGAQAGEQADSR
jgi:hypothetical protein